LTKGPFNALLPIHDLNAMLVSLILTGLGGFSTAAGHVGPEIEVGHDISLLVPEIWCRLQAKERDPAWLIGEGMLERLDDYEYAGRRILASRLGYRITAKFVRRFFGRVFDNPSKVFDERILKPEIQDPESYAEGIEHIVEAQQRIARLYFEDQSYEHACPPLKVLLEILARGSWNGQDLSSPEVRHLFQRQAILDSDWYYQRLLGKQTIDIRRWQRHVFYLTEYCHRGTHQAVIDRLDLPARLQQAHRELETCQSAEYVEQLRGTLGVDPTLV
jgi:hypothetical protein